VKNSILALRLKLVLNGVTAHAMKEEIALVKNLETVPNPHARNKEIVQILAL